MHRTDVIKDQGKTLSQAFDEVVNTIRLEMAPDITKKITLSIKLGPIVITLTNSSADMGFAGSNPAAQDDNPAGIIAPKIIVPLFDLFSHRYQIGMI